MILRVECFPFGPYHTLQAENLSTFATRPIGTTLPALCSPHFMAKHSTLVVCCCLLWIVSVFVVCFLVKPVLIPSFCHLCCFLWVIQQGKSGTNLPELEQQIPPANSTDFCRHEQDLSYFAAFQVNAFDQSVCYEAASSVATLGDPLVIGVARVFL